MIRASMDALSALALVLAPMVNLLRCCCVDCTRERPW